jgi:RHS repeat-associated protein
MTASPNRTYSNDIVGNRTAMTTSGDDPEYTWDLLNRMTEYQFDDGGGDAVTYKYRADGMRTYKVDTTGDNTETWYFHDGQMCVQDTSDDGTDVTVTKYGVGARGIDVITRKVNSGSETFGYPLYDTHGNMVATLARAPTNDFTTGNAKSYGVWGGDRSGSSSVDQGYVANLGHRTDSESDLQYMRARYYEPSTGRFISEDKGLDGSNVYIYCQNDPVNRVDFDGNFSATQQLLMSVIAALSLVIGAILMNIDFDMTKVLTRLRRDIDQLKSIQRIADFTDGTALKELRAAQISQMEEQYEMINRKRSAIRAGVQGSKIGIIVSYIGRLFILNGLLLDIDLAPYGVGGLEMVWGG